MSSILVLFGFDDGNRFNDVFMFPMEKEILKLNAFLDSDKFIDVLFVYEK
jgi:hypothetical protein